MRCGRAEPRMSSSRYNEWETHEMFAELIHKEFSSLSWIREGESHPTGNRNAPPKFLPISTDNC
jgi:hypothetical protein